MSSQNFTTIKCMSLKKKILTILTMVFFIMTASFSFTVFQIKQQTSILENARVQTQKVNKDAVPLLLALKDIHYDVIQVQQWISDISATRAQGGFDDGLKEAQVSAGNFKTHLAKARKHAKNLGLTKVLADLDLASKNFTPYYQVGIKMAKAYIKEGPTGGNKMMGSFDKVAEEIGTALEHVLTIGSDATMHALDDLSVSVKHIKTKNDKIVSTTMWIAGLTLLVILISAGYLFLFTKKNFDQILADVQLVANEDLTTPFKIKAGRSDEFGILARALLVFREGQKEKQHIEKEAADNRRLEEEKHAHMSNVAASFSANIEDIVSSVSSASTELEATAQSMTGISDQTNNQVEEVSSASQQTSHNVQSVASATEEMTSTIREIGQQVSDASNASRQAVEEVDETSQQMQELAETANKIGKVVELISGIAEQTNLLALNATIESARAGEAGKGFAVVAGEVKQLASQTTKATNEISQQISDIQSATRRASGSMETVAVTISKVEEISTIIAAAMEEQSAATQEIASSVNQAAIGTQQVSDNINLVKEASQEAQTASGQVMAAAGELSQQSEILKGEVDKFIAHVRVG